MKSYSVLYGNLERNVCVAAFVNGKRTRTVRITGGGRDIRWGTGLEAELIIHRKGMYLRQLEPSEGRQLVKGRNILRWNWHHTLISRIQVHPEIFRCVKVAKEWSFWLRIRDGVCMDILIIWNRPKIRREKLVSEVVCLMGVPWWLLVWESQMLPQMFYLRSLAILLFKTARPFPLYMSSTVTG